MMSQKLAILTLSAIALLGLPSCTTTVSAPTTAATQTQTSIKIIGSSAAFNLLTLLQTSFNSTGKNVKITQLESGQSENVIKGIKLNLIDLGAITKTLKPEENDGTLESRQIAQDALVVATHPSVTGVKNLTTEDLKGI